jgi:hypothetical protein
MDNRLKLLIIEYIKMYNNEIRRNEHLEGLISVIIDEIQTNHIEWPKRNDVRYTTFTRIQNTLRNCKLSMINLVCILNDKILEIMPADQIEDRLNEYDKYLRFSYFQHMISQMECGIRVIMRHIDHTKYYSKKEPFNNIYKFICVFLHFTKHDDFFKLIRFIRNSIHNNGLHFPDNNRSEEIEYRGKRILFENEKPVTFASWINLYDITEDIISVFKEIFETKPIAQENLIIDPVPKN